MRFFELRAADFRPWIVKAENISEAKRKYAMFYAQFAVSLYAPNRMDANHPDDYYKWVVEKEITESEAFPGVDVSQVPKEWRI